MSKSDQAKLREQRLAAKLRENLKRRKGQAKARSSMGGDEPSRAASMPPREAGER